MQDGLQMASAEALSQISYLFCLDPNWEWWIRGEKQFVWILLAFQFLLICVSFDAWPDNWEQYNWSFLYMSLSYFYKFNFCNSAITLLLKGHPDSKSESELKITFTFLIFPLFKVPTSGWVAEGERILLLVKCFMLSSAPLLFKTRKLNHLKSLG